MRVPEVSTCCCGCTLETGCKILAWVEIVRGALWVMAGIIVAAAEDYSMLVALYILIVGIVTLACGIVLLKGVNGRIVKNVNSWVMINAVLLVLNLLYLAMQTFVLLLDAMVTDAFATLIAGLIVSAINAYFIIVVFNFKREIESDEQPA